LRTLTNVATAPVLDAELTHWLRTFRGPLVGFLASRGADWAAAEELAQDTFTEAWLGRARLRAAPDDLDAVGGWLRGIAQNLLRARLRALRRVEPLSGAEGVTPAAPPDERRELLRAAFGRLRPELQEILRMHYLEATSAREVAALLGVTTKAVEGRLYQARRALRSLVEHATRATEGSIR
jgi:RNA polymerase sigma factor (sigma-70 family)